MERHAGTHPSRALCEMPPVSQAAGQPSAAIIDRQSDNSAEKRGLDRPARVRRGEGDQGKKRHLLVDTQGLVLHAIVHAANLQDRDGGALLVRMLFGLFPFLRKL